MKKSKKFLLSMCTGALATVMVVGNSGVVALAESAKIEDGSIDKSYESVKGINQSTVEYGEKIIIPEMAEGNIVTVIDPSNKVVTVENGEVVANKVGHYTITIANEQGIKYTYDVLCTSSRDYKLEIADVEIPSFLKVGTEFKKSDLPTAKVYYEEDGEKVYVEDANVDVVVTGVADEDDIAKEGTTAYVTYTYGFGVGVHVDAQYKILVQENFKDEVSPTLSVGSYTATANTNIKYTLPKATAKDAYDERVKVKITVKDPDGNPVKEASDIDDKSGYAIGYSDKEVVFDNLDNMFFYPESNGDYTITYVAVDDSGNESEPVSYVLTVKDQKGPVVNVDRSSIPEKWAYNKVYFEDENGDVVNKDDLNIYLPIPEYYDNNYKTTFDVTCTIKDPEGNVVGTIKNIQNLGKEVSKEEEFDIVPGDKVSGVSEFVLATEKAGMVAQFDVKGYVNMLKEKIGNNDANVDSDYKYAGSYTVQYTVKDVTTGSTTSSQTYSMNISDTYNDTSTIGITASTEVAKYVVLAEGDKFNLPTFVISSSSDGYLNKEYRLKVNDLVMDYTDFAGGEEIELVKDEDGYYLSYKDSKLAVKSGDLLVYEVVANADSGREAINNEKSTEIVIPVQEEKSYDVAANDTLSEITIDVLQAENKHVGVEVGLKSEDGEYVSFNATVYYNSTTQQKVIKDIEYITPNEKGTYYLEVRVYDIDGNNQVSVYKMNLEAGESEDNRESEESAFSTSTTVGKAITWKYTTIQTGTTFTSEVDKIATAHKISGGRFAWMGSEFTPLQENTYVLVDTVIPLDASGSIVPGYESVIADKFEMRSEVVATASTSKTIVLDSAMPSYLEAKAEASNIPAAVIYDAYKNYNDYTIRITDPNGNIDNYESYEKMVEEFVFSSDGTYTVAYLVNGAIVKSYSIKVGDVTPVEFDVKNYEDKDFVTKDSGYKFTFDEIILSENDKDNVSKYTFKKSIRDAEGNIVGKEYEKKGDNGRVETGSTVTLTEAGTYTVTYTVIDQSGNESYKHVTIKINAASESENFDYTVLSTVIIVVVCLGIAGIIIYYIASSRKKNKKSSKRRSDK